MPTMHCVIEPDLPLMLACPESEDDEDDRPRRRRRMERDDMDELDGDWDEVCVRLNVGCMCCARWVEARGLPFPRPATRR